MGINRKEKNDKTSIYKIAFPVAAFAITFVSIGTFSFVRDKSVSNNFTRIVTEDGNYDLEGFINYDELVKYKLIEIGTITDENKLYVAEQIPFSYEYKDIYTGKVVGSYHHESDNNNIISATDIDEFLIMYDMIKEKYSSDDINYLLNRIKEDYKNNKTLKLNYQIY